MNKLLNVHECAELLQVTERTIYTLIKDKKIPFKRIGRVYRFKPSDIEAWLGGNDE